MWLIWASLVALAEGLGFNPLGQKDPMEKEMATHPVLLLKKSHGQSSLAGHVTQFNSLQLLSWVQLFATPWTTAHQASHSITNSRSFLRLMSIELVMPSNYLTLCWTLLLLPSIFPSIRVFSNESVLHIRWQSIGVSALASVLPMNTQD